MESQDKTQANFFQLNWAPVGGKRGAKSRGNEGAANESEEGRTEPQLSRAAAAGLVLF